MLSDTLEAPLNGRDAPNGPALVLFRRDLRIDDNPALIAAADSGRPVVAVFVHETAGRRETGGASAWWVAQSLARLSEALRLRGLALVIRSGDGVEAVLSLANEIAAAAVFWNRRYAANQIDNDRRLKAALKERGIAAESFNAGLLREPWEVAGKDGGHYKVFTPFWKAHLAGVEIALPRPAPRSILAFQPVPGGETIADLGLYAGRPDWAEGWDGLWTPGEAGALERLDAFLTGPVARYSSERDHPDRDSTSRLSPHLAVGEISPRLIWHRTQAAMADGRIAQRPAEKFLSEIGWREFSYHLLFHVPTLPEANFADRFDRFPWREDDGALKAWQTGRTGYPIVDAGLRQLWQTGWMHNRVRMVTASFLTKHLMLHWRLGEAWFWDTLVDADPANNAASWQWVAGTGADAAPYFRIFNPILQGEKFDPDGAYVRRFVPELAALPAPLIHKPWDAPDAVLAQAGITLGETYPRPIVDHAFARKRALSAFEDLKTAA